MRRNRRQKKMSVAASHAMHLGAVIVVLFVMVILNLLASSNCDQIMKEIGEKERVLARLEQDRERESAKWDAMTDDSHIDASLAQLGMSMKYARNTQIVHMDSGGVPRPGQISVASDIRRRSDRKPVARNSRRRR